jgi:predicted RNase H-like HicB family nuclease
MAQDREVKTIGEHGGDWKSEGHQGDNVTLRWGLTCVDISAMLKNMATYPEYVHAAMCQAQYERMEDGEWFASIPGFDGLWASGPSIEEARAQLLEALAGWIPVHAGIGQNRIPDVGGVSLYDLPKKVEQD